MAEFDRCADATLEEVKSIYQQRGGEYADSWVLENQHAPFLRMVLRETKDWAVTNRVVRLIVAAVMVDIKDSRMGGPYKRDSVVDGIAYRALFAQLMEEWQTECNNLSKSSKSPPVMEQTVSSDHPMASSTSPTTQRLRETALV